MAQFISCSQKHTQLFKLYNLNQHDKKNLVLKQHYVSFSSNIVD